MYIHITTYTHTLHYDLFSIITTSILNSYTEAVKHSFSIFGGLREPLW